MLRMLYRFMLNTRGKTSYYDVIAEPPDLETACFRGVRMACDSVAEEAKTGKHADRVVY